MIPALSVPPSLAKLSSPAGHLEIHLCPHRFPAPAEFGDIEKDGEIVVPQLDGVHDGIFLEVLVEIVSPRLVFLGLEGGDHVPALLRPDIRVGDIIDIVRVQPRYRLQVAVRDVCQFRGRREGEILRYRLGPVRYLSAGHAVRLEGEDEFALEIEVLERDQHVEGLVIPHFARRYHAVEADVRRDLPSRRGHSVSDQRLPAPVPARGLFHGEQLSRKPHPGFVLVPSFVPLGGRSRVEVDPVPVDPAASFPGRFEGEVLPHLVTC